MAVFASWQHGDVCSGLLQASNLAQVSSDEWLKAMNLFINGEPKEVEQATSLLLLLEILKMGKGRIAIELNGEIVPRSLFQQTVLQNDDALEIVQAIGGG